MEEKIQQLKTILAEISDLEHAASLLRWDLQTYMPGGGAEGRSHQLALLKRLAHERATSPALGQILDELKPLAASLDPDSNDARLVNVTARNYNKSSRIPARHVEEFSRLTALAQQAWMEARQKSDFAVFRPHLERIVALRQEYASFFPGMNHPYDALLDDFDPGMKTADVKAIFEELRLKQVELINAIAARPQVEDAFLRQPFEPAKQWTFGEQVITSLGFDWECGRQDKSAHPFTTEIGLKDVRITTRVDANFLNPMLFGTIHECGHAFYSLGVAPELERTSLQGSASLALDESQSRLWENMVGRSRPFWKHFYPHLQQVFPQLGEVPLEKFYRGINKVAPSFIRVEADEATYNLHIMLRLEIEIALLEGKVAVRDLPDLWNAKMQEYLGVTPPSDAMGVLQDIHWSEGTLGYFPTYALGNLISAQLWEKINQDIPDLERQIETGKFEALLAWLREKIHRHGAKFEPQELVQRVTGSRIDPAAYVRYLSGKFGEIYNL
jgi:carboxypeptidase Taq